MANYPILSNTPIKETIFTISYSETISPDILTLFWQRKEIAEKFGVYSENEPVWNRFSGVDTNVPLLATYVISQYGKILYDHIDWDFSENFPSNEIISAVSRTTSLT